MSLTAVTKKLYVLVTFMGFYIYDLVMSAIRIGWDVVTISSYCSPGFIDVPLTAETDLEISILANLITFSPGSMAVELSGDRKYLRVHLMFLDDEQKAIEAMKSNIERRVLEVLR